MLGRLVGFLLVGLMVLSGQRNAHPQSSPPTVLTTPLIREEQKVLVNGIPEVWRLEWKSAPRPVCGIEDILSAITCPCTGFAYGETGQLDLVRILNGREIDHLELTPLFEKVLGEQDGAIVQRWKLEEEDLTDYESEGFAARVRMRPITQIMHFADYNHDGDSTEFFLQTGVEPCGKRTGIVVGLTRTSQRLHAFGTVRQPNKPLVMQEREWKALLEAAGRIEVLDWPCGDHGSEIESDLELEIRDGGIQAVRRDFECTETGGRGRLLRQQPL